MNPIAPKKHFSDKYKAWLTDVHANLLENRILDIVVNGDPNVPVNEEITQEQRDQLIALRKGKAPAQEAASSHGQASGHATRMRDEQVRRRSSDEDDDRDRCWKRNKRRSSNEGSAGPHVSSDARSSNQHSSIGERQNIESSNSLDQVVASHQSTLPSSPSHEEARPEPSQVSILPGAESFMSKYMVFIAGLWSDICEKLRETPAKSVSSFKGSVAKQLQFMKRDGVDLSALEERVADFFKKAEDYDKARSQLSHAMPVETQVAELCLAQGVLKEAQQKLSQTQTLLLEQQKILEDSDGQVTLLEEAIKEAEKTIKDSKEKLTKIHNDRPKLQDLVTKAQEQHNTSQEAVISAEEEVKRIQETPMLTDEDEEKLSLIKKDLEVDKEDLMNFRIL